VSEFDIFSQWRETYVAILCCFSVRTDTKNLKRWFSRVV
jgi:hypothetical protein